MISLGPNTDYEGINYTLPMNYLDQFLPILQQSGSYYRLVSGASVALAGCAAGMFLPIKKYWPIVLCIVYYVGSNHISEISTMNGHSVPLKVRSGIWDSELTSLRGGSGPVFDLPLVKQQGCDKNVFRIV